MSTKFINIGSGFKSKKNPDSVISFKNNPKYTGIKIKIVDCETGNELEVESFFAKLKTEKKAENYPDYDLTVALEE